MRARALWLVPIGLAGAFLIFRFGPYAALAAALEPHALFDEAPALTTEAVSARCGELGAEGRSLYLSFLRWDCLALVAHTLILLPLLLVPASLLALRPSRRLALIAIAMLPGALDLLENLGIASILGSAEPASWLVGLTAAATGAKLVLFTAALATAGGLWAWAGWRGITAQSRRFGARLQRERARHSS